MSIGSIHFAHPNIHFTQNNICCFGSLAPYMSKPTTAKPKAKNQAVSLEPFLELITELRVSGASLQDVAHRLGKIGVTVNRNAVDRFCKKHGIGAETATPEIAAPTNSAPLPPLRQQTAAENPVFDKKPKHATETISPTERPLASVSFSEISSSKLPEPTVEFVLPPSTSPSATQTLLLSEIWTSHAPPAPVAANRSESLAVAEVLEELNAYCKRIDEAQQSGDTDRTESIVHESLAWIDGLRSRLPSHLHDCVNRAFNESLSLLRSRTSAPQQSVRDDKPPPFEPLPSTAAWTPDLPLVEFNGGADKWTLQDACEGTLVLGATGSGKTSGSGATIAKSFLSAGFGGLVLTAKTDEPALWEQYATKTGRMPQLCVVKPGGAFRFNFLDYQSRLTASQGGATENVVDVLYSILEAFTRGSRRSDEYGGFWANTAKQLLRNLVRVMRASSSPLSLVAFRKFLNEAPQTPDEAKPEQWNPKCEFGRIISICRHLAPGSSEATEALRYWLTDFPSLNPKTRSIVVTDFTAMIDLLFDPTLEQLFLTDTTITPEAVLDGAIIVVDLPIERWLAVGRLAQLIWKFFFQLAVRRRNDPDGSSRRPAFLWIDEFQSLLSEGDTAFQATARSARCASVLLTQNLPGLYAQAGSSLPRERIDALSGNLATKVFHANTDPTTNQWAAELIGKGTQYRASVSSPDDPPRHARGLVDRLLWPARARTTVNPVIDFEVQPAEFTKLRTGSRRYGRMVDAMLVKSGARLSNGKHYMPVTFQQEAE